MEKVKEALRQPSLRALPGDRVGALNGRTLFATQLINGDVSLPGRGNFSKAIGALSTGVTVTVNGDQITLDGNGKHQLRVVPETVDVFVARIEAQEYSFVQTAPIYLTFLHLEGDAFDFYIRLSGGRAGKYLIDHPQQLPVQDVLGLKTIATGDTEPELAKAINDYGYEKLVAGTELAFLGEDNIASGYRYASVTPH